VTTDEILDYYAGLLVFQYQDKPKAYAMIRDFVAPFVLNQLPITIQNAFCVGSNLIADTTYPSAVGDQLDILGKYAGVTRNGHDLTGNPITLNDSDFASLIKIAIITNSAGSSLATIQNLLYTYFPNEIFAYDNANMQMSYLITASIGSTQLAEMFVTENLLPKPMGVSLASIAFVPTISLFGFQPYSDPISNYSSGTTYGFGSLALSNGIVYESLKANNLNQPVSNTSYWIAIIYPFNSYVTYPTYEAYKWLSYQDTLNLL